MIYREFLVMRKALLWFLGIALVCSLIAFGLSASHDHRTTNGAISELLVPVAYTVATGFAAIFGVALGNASREPSRVLWTLPESRLRSALSVIAVDIAAITLAVAGAMAAVLVAVYFYALIGMAAPQIKWNVDWLTVARMLVFNYAVYGWCALAGMLLRRMAYGGIIALPAMIFIMIPTQIHSALGVFFRYLCLVDPWVIVQAAHPGAKEDPLAQFLAWVTPESSTMLLCAIALGTCAVATALWQRSEVLA